LFVFEKDVANVTGVGMGGLSSPVFWKFQENIFCLCFKWQKEILSVFATPRKFWEESPSPPPLGNILLTPMANFYFWLPSSRSNCILLDSQWNDTKPFLRVIPIKQCLISRT